MHGSLENDILVMVEKDFSWEGTIIHTGIKTIILIIYKYRYLKVDVDIIWKKRQSLVAK